MKNILEVLDYNRGFQTALAAIAQSGLCNIDEYSFPNDCLRLYERIMHERAPVGGHFSIMWSEVKEFLVSFWVRALREHVITDLRGDLYSCSGYAVLMDIIPFLSSGDGLKGFDENDEHFILQVLAEVFSVGDEKTKKCIDTGFVEVLGARKRKQFMRMCKQRGGLKS